MCFLITPESIDFRWFKDDKNAQMFYLNFANQMKSIFYREVSDANSDEMNSLILLLNDELIVSLESLLDSSEKY